MVKNILKQLGEMLDEHLDMDEGDEGSSDGDMDSKTATVMLQVKASLNILKKKKSRLKMRSKRI